MKSFLLYIYSLSNRSLIVLTGYHISEEADGSFKMRRNNKAIRFRVMGSMLLFCVVTALSGVGFLSLSVKENLTVIGEEQVALSASVRPDQTFFPEVLFSMIFMLFMFLFYFYWRECNKQISYIRNLTIQRGFEEMSIDQITIWERLNLFYLRNLTMDSKTPQRKGTIKNIIAE